MEMLVAALMVLNVAIQANGQIPVSPCTSSMLTSFSPCINFLTNSTLNMTTPTPSCCISLKSLASNGTGCFCQILTGGIPFRVPINRTSAISLPKACNMAGVPFQCNLATGAPAPAPGSSSVGLTPPALSPTTASSPSPSTSVIPTSPAEAPVSDATPTDTSPTASSDSPPSSSVTPARTSNPATSASHPSLGLRPSLLLIPLGLAMIKYY